MVIEDIRRLFDELVEDPWRKDRSFSPDILEAHALMHYPFASTDQIIDVLGRWCQKKQPCNFGRIGAKYGHIHFCIINEMDLLGGEAILKEKLIEEKRLWKQRALKELTNPPHAFMLVVSSPRIALAAPNNDLKRFAARIRDLAGFISTDGNSAEAGGYLYLKNPTDNLHYGFKYNLDFFAAAGDGRWWHDHRAPGGIAFTANSTGHMRYWQEWYSEHKGKDRNEFFVTNAMYTIAQAHPTVTILDDCRVPSNPVEEGRVTWLRDLEIGGKPMKDSECPFNSNHKRLDGKDWTTYEGWLHTDHNIRDEFFVDSHRPPTRRPRLLDFTYLYETRAREFIEFIAGVRVAEREIHDEIGTPETWQFAGVDAQTG